MKGRLEKLMWGAQGVAKRRWCFCQPQNHTSPDSIAVPYDDMLSTRWHLMDGVSLRST